MKGDRYLLTCEKMWISLADVADHFLVFAWSDLEKKKERDTSGISAFIVERAFKGFSSGTLKEKWGILAGNTGFFKMDDVEVPAENVVGKPGEGFKIAMFALDQGASLAAGATGLIQCRDASELRERAQGVRRRDRPAPAVKEMIAQMESDCRPPRASSGSAPVGSRITAGATRADRSGEMVRHRCLERAAGDADPRRQPTRRIPRRPGYRNCKGPITRARGRSTS
jgi:glutaryl-CoA dehydrogenase (non-decarboxylating)